MRQDRRIKEEKQSKKEERVTTKITLDLVQDPDPGQSQNRGLKEEEEIVVQNRSFKDLKQDMKKVRQI